MSEKIHLYDIREKDYPNKRHDTFRSLQVFECNVCEALTNFVIMGGSPGLGMRVLCPHSSDCWHHDLAMKIRELRLTYKSEPQRFREKVTEILGALRRFKILTDDILGVPDLSLKSSVSNYFSKPQDKKCLHEFSSALGVYRLLDYLYQ